MNIQPTNQPDEIDLLAENDRLHQIRAQWGVNGTDLTRRIDHRRKRPRITLIKFEQPTQVIGAVEPKQKQTAREVQA